MFKTLSTTLLLLGIYNSAHAADVNYLQQCFQNQVGTLNGNIAEFSFTMHEQQTYHSPEPWQVLHNYKNGRIWAGHNSFAMCDTIIRGAGQYVSKEQFSPGVLLVQPYWLKKPMEVTQSQLEEEVYDIAKYNPAMLISHVAAINPAADYSTGGYAMYTAIIHKSVVTLYINRKNSLVEKVTITGYHDMYGDVTHTINYSDFLQYKRYYYARNVHYSKVNNITDTLRFSLKNIVNVMPVIIEKPTDYIIKQDKPEVYKLVRHKLSKHIHTLHLTQAGSIATLVEFKDFFVVIDVPHGSTNGELVQQEANKIAPGKPVKYYAFGHHHPWYLGGVRSFIHAGATILTVKENIPYIQFLANASHSLQPDSLHLQRRSIKTQVIDNMMDITDGAYKMKLFHIGDKSDHTKDYIIFYFPEEKLVLEGDLLWASDNMATTPASDRTIGFYNAVKELQLEVDTVLQTWPWGDEYKVRTHIPFTDIEKSAKLAKPQ